MRARLGGSVAVPLALSTALLVAGRPLVLDLVGADLARVRRALLRGSRRRLPRLSHLERSAGVQRKLKTFERNGVRLRGRVWRVFERPVSARGRTTPER